MDRADTRGGYNKADRAIERQPRPLAVREFLGAVRLHLYRIDAREEQVNCGFKLEARLHRTFRHEVD